MASLITGGELHLTNTSLKIIPMVYETLEKAGGIFQETPLGFKVKSNGKVIGTDL
jgi:hypothetical protein